MVSGRKDRVAISCVTFEVAKVVDPIEYYEATRVHLLSTSSEGDIYREFLDEVCRRISDYSKRTQIVRHISQKDEEGNYDFTVYETSLDLKGQLTGTGEHKGDPGVYEEVYEALKGLGFKGAAIDRVLATINEPEASPEEVLRLALNKLRK